MHRNFGLTRDFPEGLKKSAGSGNIKPKHHNDIGCLGFHVVLEAGLEPARSQ